MVIKFKGCTYKITHIAAANIPRKFTLGTCLKLRHFSFLKNHYVKLSIF